MENGLCFIRNNEYTLSTSKDGFNWSGLKTILNKGNEQSWESIVYWTK